MAVKTEEGRKFKESLQLKITELGGGIVLAGAEKNMCYNKTTIGDPRTYWPERDS